MKRCNARCTIAIEPDGTVSVPVLLPSGHAISFATSGRKRWNSPLFQRFDTGWKIQAVPGCLKSAGTAPICALCRRLWARSRGQDEREIANTVEDSCMNLTQLWNSTADKPFDPRRDLLKPRLNAWKRVRWPGLYHYLREVDESPFPPPSRLRWFGSSAGQRHRRRPIAALGAIIAKALLDGEDDASCRLQNTFHDVSVGWRPTTSAEFVRSLATWNRPVRTTTRSSTWRSDVRSRCGPTQETALRPTCRLPRLSCADSRSALGTRDSARHVDYAGRFERASGAAIEHARRFGNDCRCAIRGSDLAEEVFVSELAAAGVDHIRPAVPFVRCRNA